MSYNGFPDSFETIMNLSEDYILQDNRAIEEVLVTGCDPKLPVSNSSDVTLNPLSTLSPLAYSTNENVFSITTGESTNLNFFVNENSSGEPIALETLQATLPCSLGTNHTIESSFLDFNNINDVMSVMTDVEDMEEFNNLHTDQVTRNTEANLHMDLDTASTSAKRKRNLPSSSTESSSSRSKTSEDNPVKTRRTRVKKPKLWEMDDVDENPDSSSKIQRAKAAKNTRDKHKLEVSLLKQQVLELEGLKQNYKELQNENNSLKNELKKTADEKDQEILALTKTNSFLTSEVKLWKLEAFNNSKTIWDEDERKLVLDQINETTCQNPTTPFKVAEELADVLSTDDLKQINDIQSARPAPRQGNKTVTMEILFGVKKTTDSNLKMTDCSNEYIE